MFRRMALGSGSLFPNIPKCEARSINRVKSWVWNKNYGSFDADATRREREMCSGSNGGTLVSVELGTGNTAAPVVAEAR